MEHGLQVVVKELIFQCEMFSEKCLSCFRIRFVIDIDDTFLKDNIMKVLVIRPTVYTNDCLLNVAIKPKTNIREGLKSCCC